MSTKWYEQRFISHRDWILDHLEMLGLNEQEALLVLVMDFMNEHRLEISIDSLSAKTGMNKDKVNEVISGLVGKRYLEITAAGRNVAFRLDGLFETDTARQVSALSSSLFDLFETEMGRPLSQKEMETISDWGRDREKEMIIFALREASMYQKVSLPYIQKIMDTWQKEGITVQMLKEGKTNAGRKNSGRA